MCKLTLIFIFVVNELMLIKQFTNHLQITSTNMNLKKLYFFPHLFLFSFRIYFAYIITSIILVKAKHVKMSSSKITKISKKHENTWAQLHRQLISPPFSYKDVFPEEVYNYIENQAVSRSSSIGYMVLCLLTSTAFVAGMNNSAVAVSQDHKVPFNLYSMIVGPPTTGKLRKHLGNMLCSHL